MRQFASATLELAGVAAVVYGLFLWTPIIGFVALGAAGIVVGLALDPPLRAPRASVVVTEVSE